MAISSHSSQRMLGLSKIAIGNRRHQFCARVRFASKIAVGNQFKQFAERERERERERDLHSIKAINIKTEHVQHYAHSLILALSGAAS